MTKYPTGNITELNEIIYARSKLVCDKIGVPLRNASRNIKLGCEIKQEEQVKKLWQQARVLRKESMQRYVEMKRPKQNSGQVWQYNLKRYIKRYWRKKGGLKDTETNRIFENSKRKSYQLQTTLLRSARILSRVLETRGDLLSLKLLRKTISYELM